MTVAAPNISPKSDAQHGELMAVIAMASQLPRNRASGRTRRPVLRLTHRALTHFEYPDRLARPPNLMGNKRQRVRKGQPHLDVVRVGFKASERTANPQRARAGLHPQPTFTLP